MAAESVKVIVRCRPMNERENNLNCKTVISMDSARGQCGIQNPADEKAPPKTFTFDGAYFTQSTTEQLYADIAYPLVEGVTEGYNGTIFAYGQTGCGKSFTMQGITDPATQRGIIPRAFDHIFETISVTGGTKFLVHASYLEIYNEEIRDLLGKDVKVKLDLKEHPEKGVYVQGLSMHPVHNVLECERVMQRGWKNRSTGATLMNADSSRSHSIFSIRMEMCTADESGEEHIRAGKLNLVDLAGSERQAKTGASGDRLKEATKINLSLSALGNVISALVDGKSKHIPYRDSKLTRLLQDSLGGNTKTLMVACLSPADNNYDETLSTLRYANRAKNIKNKPKINEDPKDALLREYQEEINKLRAMLRGEIPVDFGEGGAPTATKQKTAPPPEVVEKVVHVDSGEAIEEERQKIKQEYEERIVSLKSEFDQMKMSKDKLQSDMSRLRDFYDGKLSELDAGNLPPPGVVLGEMDRYEATDKENELSRPSSVLARDTELTGHDGGTEMVSVTSSDLRTGSSPEEDLYPQTADSQGQLAIHLSTTHQADYDDGLYAPSSSPTELQTPRNLQHEEALRSDMDILRDNMTSGEQFQSLKIKSQTSAMTRLQELQQQMVGGEAINNEEVKERHIKRKKHADETQKRLAEAVKMDGDEIMLNIYDNVQDKLRAVSKQLEKQKEKTESLERDIVDLQSEFEFDRNDYLDTIRKQEKQMKLQQALLEKMQPCIRRDCNYSNLDRIKLQSDWDEERQVWVLPQMTLEKTRLPPTAPGSGREHSPRESMSTVQLVNGYAQPSIYDEPQEDRYRQRLNQNEEFSSNYFKSKRTSQLLSHRNDSRSNSQNGTASGTSVVNGHSEMRAMQVHGQINQDDFPIRKPARLESLPPPSAKNKKKKKHMNALEPI